MHRMGLRASDYFHLPPKSVMEVGFRLDQIRTGYARGPRPMTFMYEGQAQPR